MSLWVIEGGDGNGQGHGQGQVIMEKFMQKLKSCSDILKLIEKSQPNAKAFNDHMGDGWRAWPTGEFLDSIRFITLGLYAIGMRRGDRIGIFANSSTKWSIADLAIMISGGVSVPIIPNVSEDNFLYEVKEAELNIIFVDGEEQWSLFQKYRDMFEKAIGFGKCPEDLKAISFQEVIEKGKGLHRSQPKLYDQLREALKPSDIGTIIYTSGSTGVPKGVELTHGNLTCVLNYAEFHWDAKKDRYLSVLPLAHIFGRCINLWVLSWGASVYYTSDYKKLKEICQEVQPTAIVVVPRLLEKVYMKMVDKVHTSSPLKKAIGEWAFKLAKKDNPTSVERMLLKVADKLVYGKLRDGLGGKIRIVISGGAPLSPHLQRFFDTVGIPIYEGWGLTEACPVTVNTPQHKKLGTVGKPLHDQKVVISPQGEVLVKGTLVMRGYFRHPELTAAAIDSQGWLHTGDRGTIDKNGYLTILGRIKELYKTSTGEYVAPVPIEQAIGRLPLIDMSMVIAEGRKFTSCLLFPNMEMLARIKAQKNADGMSNEAFLESTFIKKEMEKHFEDINKHLNHWEQVNAYRFILEPLTIQNGELTPSMKIRREAVLKKYKNVIDEMYHEETE